uniref:ThiF/MoeB/HesA family E1-like protein n=1 Tax=uncultured bacterium CSL142 TaxID=1091569 RepID=G4WVL8_9BACT|nr:ThiF/MoeB/HesA family E1-like protein [uncultured bacterium CSL142]
MSTPPAFDYFEAFSRNIGWVTRDEQAVLRTKRVAIAGLGGAGGDHVMALTRLGITKLNISDFDSFAVPNFNRQIGATMSTLGRPKIDVIAAMARDINPEMDIRCFPQGVNTENLADFLTDVDLYLDGLDFFVLPARRATFAACERAGIPTVTAAPLGMGTAYLTFMPGKMTFEEYFRLDGVPEDEQFVLFMLGLAPARLQYNYVVDPAAVRLDEKRGPSTVIGCQLCAGVAATQALKILLGRGKILAAPWGLHFDAYNNKFARTWRPWGNKNPWQRLLIVLAKRRLASMRAASANNAS